MEKLLVLFLDKMQDLVTAYPVETRIVVICIFPAILGIIGFHIFFYFRNNYRANLLVPVSDQPAFRLFLQGICSCPGWNKLDSFLIMLLYFYPICTDVIVAAFTEGYAGMSDGTSFACAFFVIWSIVFLGSGTIHVKIIDKRNDLFAKKFPDISKRYMQIYSDYVVCGITPLPIKDISPNKD